VHDGALSAKLTYRPPVTVRDRTRSGAISARDDQRHKLWTDDYLAAFAQASGATLTTLDRKMPARYPSVQVELLR
jgi:hypothetical protein